MDKDLMSKEQIKAEKIEKQRVVNLVNEFMEKIFSYKVIHEFAYAGSEHYKELFDSMPNKCKNAINALVKVKTFNRAFGYVLTLGIFYFMNKSIFKNNLQILERKIKTEQFAKDCKDVQNYYKEVAEKMKWD